MICPKCGYDNRTDPEDCARCGVIFARIREPGPERTEPAVSSFPAEDPLVQERQAIFSAAESNSPSIVLGVWGQRLLLLGMMVWGVKLIFASIASNTAGESLLHLINLPFHEAGHVLFRPFGQFMTSLGGSLTQLLVPLICGGTLLLKNHDPFGAAVCGWWFGENLLDLAPYIGDARAGVLPLVGAILGIHPPMGFTTGNTC